MNKEQILADRLRHATYAYLNEEAARNIARREFAEFEIIVVHSPHDGNPKIQVAGHPASRMDYWIDAPGIVRSWERVLYSGLGKNA